MTYDEAITKLVNTSDELKNIIIQLQTENAFLVETIEKNNLGQIKSERQFLLRENEKCKKESQFAIKEANQIKKEYEYKISEVDDILADVKKKQSEIVLYINNEAEKKIEGIKAEYKNQKESNNRALEQCVLENEKKNA